MSGAEEVRLRVVTASARSLPERACESAADAVRKRNGTCPASTSATAGPPPPVRHVHDVDSGPELQQLGRDVAGRAAAGRGVSVVAGALPGRSDQFAQRLRRRVRVRGDELRHAHEERYGGEVALDVVVELVEERIDSVRGEREQKDVAVGRALGHRLGADRAAGAAPILDDDSLPEALRELGLHYARGDVDGAPGRE